ncbi:hypothetical protein AB0C93_20110 [Streptomyces sp. NPDC048518]
MSENTSQDLFDIDLTETAIQDVDADSAAGGFSDDTCFRTCTTCAVC